MTPHKLACPKCRRTVPEVYWQGVDVVRCPACEGEFEQLRFPALAAARRVERAGALGAGEANCYFHAENRAEVACDGCGRYVCAVCRVAISGRNYCPSCLETRADRRKLPENHRLLYDRIALVAAFLPLIVWPATLITAPLALGLCLYAWRKPGSVIPGWRRTRLVVAGLFATVQIGAWLYGFGVMLLK
ncbi:hypothetical protein [Oleiharenicola sp. Vm1]|uniref:hypothetical protein n=1 Tax=Oleiharenicola sp. Vm1 TaxID=3398393 RepID=UPI0039F464BA